jgi:hypothetical protein
MDLKRWTALKASSLAWDRGNVMDGGEDFVDQIHRTLGLLVSHGVVFKDGLSEKEMQQAERTFGFRFPPDLKALLRTAMPVGIRKPDKNTFPNWRSGDHNHLRGRVDRPLEGLMPHIEQHGFWMDDWGPRPNLPAGALEVARQALRAAPKLIPLYEHRYLPADPLLAGNPVFSVWETDVIFYGCNLWDYFQNEFAPQAEWHQPAEGVSQAEWAAAHRKIRFWSNFPGTQLATDR